MPAIVVTTRRIAHGWHGYDLRVVSLCLQLGTAQHLLVVPADDADAPDDATIEMAESFESVTEVDLQRLGIPGSLRHFRLSEQHYLRRTHPRFFAGAVRTLRELFERTAADRLIVFGPTLAGVAAAAGTRRVLFDVIDSAS